MLRADRRIAARKNMQTGLVRKVGPSRICAWGLVRWPCGQPQTFRCLGPARTEQQQVLNAILSSPTQWAPRKDSFAGQGGVSRVQMWPGGGLPLPVSSHGEALGGDVIRAQPLVLEAPRLLTGADLSFALVVTEGAES